MSRQTPRRIAISKLAAPAASSPVAAAAAPPPPQKLPPIAVTRQTEPVVDEAQMQPVGAFLPESGVLHLGRVPPYDPRTMLDPRGMAPPNNSLQQGIYARSWMLERVREMLIIYDDPAYEFASAVQSIVKMPLRITDKRGSAAVDELFRNTAVANADMYRRPIAPNVNDLGHNILASAARQAQQPGLEQLTLPDEVYRAPSALVGGSNASAPAAASGGSRVAAGAVPDMPNMEGAVSQRIAAPLHDDDDESATSAAFSMPGSVPLPPQAGGAAAAAAAATSFRQDMETLSRAPEDLGRLSPRSMRRAYAAQPPEARPALNTAISLLNPDRPALVVTDKHGHSFDGRRVADAVVSAKHEPVPSVGMQGSPLMAAAAPPLTPTLTLPLPSLAASSLPPGRVPPPSLAFSPSGSPQQVPSIGPGVDFPDGRPNIAVPDGAGGDRYIYNLDDGAAMGLRRFVAGGTTPADLAMWRMLYDEGRGVDRAPRRESASDASRRMDAARQQIMAHALAISAAGDNADLSWRTLPEHLGFVFLTDDLRRAINEAAWMVHYRVVRQFFQERASQLERERTPAIDLMTHEMTRVPFTWLVAYMILRARAYQNQARGDSIKMLERLDNDIAGTVEALAQVHYSVPGGYLLIANSYNPVAYTQRLLLSAKRARYSDANGRAFTDVPSSRAGFATQPLLLSGGGGWATPQEAAIAAAARHVITAQYGEQMAPRVPLTLAEVEEAQRRAALMKRAIGGL